MAKAKKGASFYDVYQEYAVDDNDRAPVKIYSTGSLLLDLTTQVGGIPTGTHCTFWGVPGSHKTSLAQIIAGERLRKGKYVLWFDFENAFTEAVAKRNGIDIWAAKFRWMRDNPRRDRRLTYEAMESIIRAFHHDPEISDEEKHGSLIVIDSHSAIRVAKSLSNEEGKDTIEDPIAARAKRDSSFNPLMKSYLGAYGTTLIVIHQVRADFNAGWGSDGLRMEGSKASGHSSDIEFKFVKGASIKNDEGQPVGRETHIIIERFRHSSPFTRATVPFRYDLPDCAIDQATELLEMGVKAGLIDKSGSWYSYEGNRWQGLDKFRDAIYASPNLAKTLDWEIRQVAGFVSPENRPADAHLTIQKDVELESLYQGDTNVAE